MRDMFRISHEIILFLMINGFANMVVVSLLLLM